MNILAVKVKTSDGQWHKLGPCDVIVVDFVRGETRVEKHP